MSVPVDFYEIFSDLENKLVVRLNGDAFFSDPDRAVLAIAENRMDLGSELDMALAKLGIACVLSVTDVQPDQVGAYHGAVVVTVTIVTFEIPLINRAESGARKTFKQILVKTLSLFAKPWTPDKDSWSAAEFAGYTSTKQADEETASVIREIKFNFRTILETVVQVLATGDGRELVTENQENLIISPTPA